jgi:predicted RNase H-related nuclease YkuK (DUF458 family)
MVCLSDNSNKNVELIKEYYDMTRKVFDINEVKDFINATSDETRIYIGADSERHRRGDVWYADYTVAIVIHYDGCRGCKVFGQVTSERDYDKRHDRPATRLMNEVYRASQMYLDLEEVIGDRHVEVHLDINPDILHGSSCVVQQAIGYVRGVCNVVPMVKPDAFAASYAADRLKVILAA